MKGKPSHIDGYIPPHDLEAEEAVIGSILADTRGMPVVYEIIGDIPEVFYKEAHQTIYRAALDLYLEEKPIDIITMSSRISSMSKLEEIGGNRELGRLSSKVSTAAHSKEWSLILMEKWMRRSSIAAATNLIQKSYDPEEDIDTSMITSSVKLEEIRKRLKKKEPRTISEMVAQMMERIVKKSSGNYDSTSWGIPSVDHKMGVPEGGDAVYIGARPGMGKTALVIQMAKANAKIAKMKKEGKRVVLYSFEMKDWQIVTRAVANEGTFDMDLVYKGKGFDAETMYDSLASHAEDIFKDIPLDIEDNNMEFEDLIIDIKHRASKHPMQMIIIDYLQMLSTKRKFQNRDSEMGYMTNTLKSVAKELDCPIVILSQLSREVEKRPNKRPQQSDFRESGNIEQAADIIIGLLRPSYYGIDAEYDEFIFLKFRNGDPGYVPVSFDGAYQCWRDYQVALKAPDKTYHDPSEPRRLKTIENDGDDLPF